MLTTEKSRKTPQRPDAITSIVDPSEVLLPPIGGAPDNVARETPTYDSSNDELVEGQILALPLSSIEPNPFQPRRSFNEAELEELAISIREHGLLQPVVVRAKPDAPIRQLLARGGFA